MTSFVLAGFLVGHLFTSYGKVEDVGRLHYWTHTLYALLEPRVLKTVDFMTTNKFFTKNPVGKAILWYMSKTNVLLPHGVVIPTGAAIHIMRDIEKYSEGQGHIAVGSCVCQRELGKYKEPTVKDMTIWYGAEIYKRRHADDYNMIGADEAADMLREFHKAGLTHVIEFCMQSRKWAFVICNCDKEICCPVRVYNLTGCTVLSGPFIVEQKDELCLGKKECGACIGRCNFYANSEENGKVSLDLEKCLGCGLCVTTCKGKARRLTRRPGYKGRLLPWDYVKGAEVEI